MKIFISWAERGSQSDHLAAALHDWLPTVLQAVDPWLSSESLDAGTRWGTEVAAQLEQTDFGVLCVGPDSAASQWLNFEAGALSKKVSRAKVIPVLIGLSVSQVSGPLTQFQAVSADEHGIRKLLHSINKELKDPVELSRLDRLFGAVWPELRDRIEKIPPTNNQVAAVDSDRVLVEILEIVRGLSRTLSTPLPSLEDVLTASIVSPRYTTKLGSRFVDELLLRSHFVRPRAAATMDTELEPPLEGNAGAEKTAPPEKHESLDAKVDAIRERAEAVASGDSAEENK